MFSIEVSPEVIRYAENLTETSTFARRRIANGTHEQQLTGLIGQTAVHNLLWASWPVDLGKADAGVDFEFWGVGIDVKTMGRRGVPRREWVNNYSALQMGSRADVVLFTSLDLPRRTLTICGWLPKSEIARRGQFWKRGTCRIRGDGSYIFTRSNLFEIRNDVLNTAENFQELLIDLINFGEEKFLTASREAA